MKQEFGIGDIAMLDGKFRVKILDCFQDEDECWYYEVDAVDFKASFTREVPQGALARI